MNQLRHAARPVGARALGDQLHRPLLRRRVQGPGARSASTRSRCAIASVIVFLMVAFQLAWPAFAYSIEDEHVAKRTYAFVLTYLLLVCCWISLVLGLLSPWIVQILAPRNDGFWRASEAVGILAFAGTAYAGYTVLAIGIGRARRTQFNWIVTGAAALAERRAQLRADPALRDDGRRDLDRRRVPRDLRRDVAQRTARLAGAVPVAARAHALARRSRAARPRQGRRRAAAARDRALPRLPDRRCCPSASTCPPSSAACDSADVRAAPAACRRRHRADRSRAIGALNRRRRPEGRVLLRRRAHGRARRPTACSRDDVAERSYPELKQDLFERKRPTRVVMSLGRGSARPGRRARLPDVRPERDPDDDALPRGRASRRAASCASRSSPSRRGSTRRRRARTSTSPASSKLALPAQPVDARRRASISCASRARSRSPAGRRSSAGRSCVVDRGSPTPAWRADGTLTAQAPQPARVDAAFAFEQADARRRRARARRAPTAGASRASRRLPRHALGDVSSASSRRSSRSTATAGAFVEWRREARGRPPRHVHHRRRARQRRLLRGDARAPPRQEDGQPGRPDRLPPLLRRRARLRRLATSRSSSTPMRRAGARARAWCTASHSASRRRSRSTSGTTASAASAATDRSSSTIPRDWRSSSWSTTAATSRSSRRIRRFPRSTRCAGSQAFVRTRATPRRAGRCSRARSASSRASSRAATGAAASTSTTTAERRGVQGAGTVHHVAWASTHGGPRGVARRRRARGRCGRRRSSTASTSSSIYFREPSGVLFEIATLGPGFATDEPPEHLGERLSLPPDFEHLRERVEPLLTPLPNPRATRARRLARSVERRDGRACGSSFAHVRR